jgi:PEP-CTERM motif
MKRAVLLVAFGVILISTVALADTTVTYYTTGAFSTGGTNVLNVGGKTLTFNAESLNKIALSGYSIAPLGSFTENGTLSVPSGETFTLTIWELTPGAGSATDIGTIAGKFTVNPSGTSKSTVFLDFTSNVYSFNGTKYSTPAGSPIAGVAWGVASVNPISTNTTTSLNGLVQSTPEPGSLLLLGVGVSGLLTLVRRKRS